MSSNIVVPALGESVTEATVAKWMKQQGDSIAVDEALVELETDKVTLEVYAPTAGVLSEIRVPEGQSVEVGAVLGVIGDGAGAAKPTLAAKPAAAPAPAAAKPAPAAKPAMPAAEALSPAVRKLIEENKLDAAAIPASGKDGRLTKEDVQKFLETRAAKPAPAVPQPAAKPAPAPAPAAPAPRAAPRELGAREERVRMTGLRKSIAARLKLAQNTAAMLTTFNEVDMTNVMALRAHHKDIFEKKHGVKLGFMSFFVKAAIVALREIPAVNGEIDGD